MNKGPTTVTVDYQVPLEDIQFQLDNFRNGIIEKEDFFQAMDEILHGKIEPPIKNK